ncbi:hypothetical protein EYF80_041393 [Liparis tanakae]|uniref:Uncharacterized protein n=1 Tax=Liparis tanakae TaxID=230148 RepID=A0A4Z2G4C3_9TELE|nr:hypothetical protein EYF80_041393 [Liparis tanakae]
MKFTLIRTFLTKTTACPTWTKRVCYLSRGSKVVRFSSAALSGGSGGSQRRVSGCSDVALPPLKHA